MFLQDSFNIKLTTCAHQRRLLVGLHELRLQLLGPKLVEQIIVIHPATKLVTRSGAQTAKGQVWIAHAGDVGGGLVWEFSVRTDGMES